MAKDILIVANGNISNLKWHQEMAVGHGPIITADGGADNCLKLGIKPDHVIGDLDSISDGAREKFADIITEDKDEHSTDLMKALRLAESLQPTSITIIGALGTRMDHTIANILSLRHVTVPTKIIDEHNIITIATSNVVFENSQGNNLSVIALSDVSGLTYTGLKYPVENLDVEAGWIGTSNKITESRATINFSGALIIIQAVDTV